MSIMLFVEMHWDKAALEASVLRQKDKVHNVNGGHVSILQILCHFKTAAD